MKLLVNSVFLFTTPSIALYPQSPLSRTTINNDEVSQVPLDRLLSYDDILNFMESIENGNLESECNLADLERINQFLVELAREGILPNEFEEAYVLENDIQELLYGHDNSHTYSFAFNHADDVSYLAIPAIFYDDGQIILCKSWVDKKIHQIKKFIKKHKKEILIGAAVVVAAAAVICTAAAAAAAAGTAAGAAAAASGPDKHEPSKSTQKEESPISSVPAEAATNAEIINHNAPILKAAVEEQIASFKQTMASEHFFPFSNPLMQREGLLSWEENGRTLGSLFAHESFKNIKNQLSDHPNLMQEVQALGSQFHFPLQKVNNDFAIDFGHVEIDRKFSTDYAHLYTIPEKEADFNTLIYQMRGEKALAFGYYEQAVHDFGKAIERNPLSPLSYLERGVAHFGLGQYDRSLEDYHQYSSQTQKTSSSGSKHDSLSGFSQGFAKALPQGIYDSGKGLFLFLSNFVKHPVHTVGQLWDAFSILGSLAHSGEWNALFEAVVPEGHQLVTQWDSLSSDARGELAGYVFGKYGSDIVLPGAIAKVASKGLKGAQELATALRGLQTAEKTLLLETVAGLENGAKIAEVVRLEKQISEWLGEGTQLIRNKAEDPIFLSKDGLRKVRFDFNRSAPHENPHMHIEQLVNGEWKEISRVYPIDVPHK
jgi:tetratricopeptide (TPR) repeat protein